MKDSTLIHVAQVAGANISALTVYFTHINELLTALSLTLASAYTLYKFYKDIKKKKEDNQ